MRADDFQPSVQVDITGVVVLIDPWAYTFFEDCVGIDQTDRPPRHVMSFPAITVDSIDQKRRVIARHSVQYALILQGQIRA